MPKTRKVNHDEQLVRAILRVLGQRGYDHLTVAAVARAVQSKKSDILKKYPDRASLLIELFHWVDAQVALQIGRERNLEGSAQDRLFEVMMARLDVLQDHRAAFLAAFEGVRRDGCVWVGLVPHVFRSMGKMHALAGGKGGAFHAAGLVAVYLAVVRVWAWDESPDLAATMAELDKRLSQVARIVDKIPNTQGA